MKQSDLEFLLKFENITTNSHKRILQSLIQEKQTLIDTCMLMNTKFLASSADIQAAPYLKFRAIENIRIEKKIKELDTQIEQAQDDIRTSVKEEKKYDILKQDMITQAHKKNMQYQENLTQEYTAFKYFKR